MRHTHSVGRAKAELLESRVLLAANIHLTDAYLTDSNFNRLAGPPVVGQFYGVRVEFTTTGLPADARYSVQYLVDGKALPGNLLTAGAGLPAGPSWDGRALMFASGGQHDIQVKVDWQNTVAESDEGDNQVGRIRGGAGDGGGALIVPETPGGLETRPYGGSCRIASRAWRKFGSAARAAS